MSTVIDGRKETVSLPAGMHLAVTASTGAGRVTPLSGSGFTDVAAGATETFGPYTDTRSFRIEALDGPMSYVASAVDFPTETEARQFGTDLYDLSGDGVPTASVQASLTVNPAGDDNALTFTAKTAGIGGNAIAVEYLDPGAASQSLAVSVRYGVISVSLATGSGSAITSTAAAIKAAIEAKAAAAALVTVAVATADSGSADDGTGVVTAMARASLANGAGVGAGAAAKGSRYTDITNGTLYINTGTKAVPVWTQLAPVA